MSLTFQQLRKIFSSIGLPYLGDATMSQTNATHGGLEQRFLILRRDGRPLDPKAGYMVLDMTGRDQAAQLAIGEYADEIQAKNGPFAEQLRNVVFHRPDLAHGFQTGGDLELEVTVDAQIERGDQTDSIENVKVAARIVRKDAPVQGHRIPLTELIPEAV